MRYREGTCPHCRGSIKATPNAGWNYVCCQCGRVWIIIDKIYWLAGFDAGGAIYKIERGKMEEVREFDPLWEQLWNKYREGKKQ